VAPRCLAPLPVPAGPEVLALLPHLRRALHGDGDALLPHDASTPPPELGVGLRLGEGEDDPHDPTAIVVAGSGSSGRPKGSLLPASALLASASATHDRLGGPGRWLLALRAHHVAGLQVLVRSLVSGTTPVAMDLSAGFHPGAFVAAARQLTGARRYTALVPTQLVRLLDAGPDAVAAVASLDAVLVGGAALPRSLADRARAATPAAACCSPGRCWPGATAAPATGRRTPSRPMPAGGAGCVPTTSARWTATAG
jgi:O-succinylbenzoic acid--CoA ligase